MYGQNSFRCDAVKDLDRDTRAVHKLQPISLLILLLDCYFRLTVLVGRAENCAALRYSQVGKLED